MAPLPGSRISEATRALYARVAFYYYRRGFTQENIAKTLQMSRQRVNRILSECIDLGIVEIRIHANDVNYMELETRLEEKFGLKAVRVASGVTPENAYLELGVNAARYLVEVIRDDDIIGFSRGKTLSAMVSHIPAINPQNLTAVQLMGGWNDLQSNASGDDIVHRFGERVPVRMVMLYAPVLLQDKKLRETIVREPYFLEAYKIIKSCTIAVLGIGQVGMDTLLPNPYGERLGTGLPPETVGEVCARFYDIRGNPVKSDFDERVVAIAREDLKNIPLRIGIAGLPSKLPAVLGALRGGYVNALITDAETAIQLIKEA